MKKFFFLFILTFYFGKVECQTLKSYNDYLKKECNPIILKFTDPNFPSDNISLETQNNKMEEYAKLHPPIPLLHDTGNPVEDKSRCNQSQTEWLKNNPYFPQFIPYHLYNQLLTPVDDIKYYEAAKTAWEKANPEKTQEIINKMTNKSKSTQ